MGILVQLVLAAILSIPGYWLWLAVLVVLGAGADALLYAAMLDIVSSLWLAHKLYWRHVRKHSDVSYAYYPPGAGAWSKFDGTDGDQNERVQR